MKTCRQSIADIELAIQQHILENGLADALLAVAYSGGLDSACLLVALIRLVGPERVRVLHVRHNLRPAAELLHETLVMQRLCCQLGVALQVYDLDQTVIRKLAQVKGLEAAAREQRYLAFHAFLKRSGCRAMLVAHHRDDDIETQLLAFFKGGSLAALAGMAVYNVPFLRPLLGTSRSTLEQIAAQEKIPFIHDSSNDELCFERNKLRLKILPLLKEFFPYMDASLVSAKKHYRRDSDYLHQQVQEFFSSHVRDETHLPLEAFFALHPALREKVLFRMLGTERVPRKAIESLLLERKPEASFVLVIKNRTLRLKDNWIVCEPSIVGGLKNSYVMNLQPGVWNALPAWGELCLQNDLPSDMQAGVFLAGLSVPVLVSPLDRRSRETQENWIELSGAQAAWALAVTGSEQELRAVLLWQEENNSTKPTGLWCVTRMGENR